MVAIVSKYRGFEIWRYNKDELTSQTVYTIKGLHDIPDIPGFRRSEQAAKNLIDKTLRSKKFLIENYNNFNIFYDFRKKKYFTEQKNTVGRAKTAKTKKEIINWIDRPKQIEVSAPRIGSGVRESFKNPRSGRISHLRSGTLRYNKAMSEGWEKIEDIKEHRRTNRVQEKMYRGYKGWRVEGGWKTELTGEEVFRTWNLAARAITNQHRKNRLASI